MNQCIHNIDLLRWMMGGQSVNVIEEWWFSDFLDNPEEVKAKFHENPPNVYGYGHTPLYADMINAIA
jgi:predicted dehydrogenase